MTVLAATEPASPFANAFFFIALFIAVGYFGWRFYDDKRKKEEAEQREADASEAIEAESPEVAGDVEAADDSADGQPEERRDS